MNIDYSSWDASNDHDLFITSIETMAASGVDGLILDPDTTYYTGDRGGHRGGIAVDTRHGRPVRGR